MPHLLQEYIREILEKAIIVERRAAAGERTPVSRSPAGIDGPPTTLGGLAKLLRDASNDTSAKTRGDAIEWGGTLEDLKNAVTNIGRTAKLSLVKDRNGEIKRVDDKKNIDLYTKKKGAFLTFINLQIPIENRKTVTIVIKPDLSLVDPEQCANKLKSGMILGYGAEHAIFSALAGTSPKDMIEEMTNNDMRLVTLLGAAKDIAPEALEEYFTAITEMRSQIDARKNTEFLNVVADVGSPPGGGSSEYDIVAYATNRSGKRISSRKVVIHAKYDDDRLVGIPQAKGASEKTKEKVSKEFADDVVVPPSASNIYKDVRDAFLFKVPKGPAEALSGNILRDEDLTPAGKKVLKQQKKAAKPEAEINVIMKDEALRNELLSNLEAAGFLETISSDIKRQLGLDIKLQSGEKFKDMLSIFVNFQTDLTPHILKFDSGQGESWNLEVTPTDESPTAANAYDVAAVSADGATTIPNIMRIELGSIKRAKYVQVHKGDKARFGEWVDALSQT